MSIETAQEFALLKQENNLLKKENKHLKGLCDEHYKSFEKLFKRVNDTISYIENDMPYLEEPDEEFERCDGTTYMTMKKYDTSILLKKLKGEENE